MTMRMCCFALCISRSNSLTLFGSGTTSAGRCISRTVRVLASASEICSTSCANAMPVMSSSDKPYTGTREKACSLMSCVNSATVVVSGTANISGRGVITSRTTMSPNSTTDRTRARSLSSRMPFFFTRLKQRIDAFIGMVRMLLVAMLCERCDGQQQTQHQRHRQDQVEQNLQRQANA